MDLFAYFNTAQGVSLSLKKLVDSDNLSPAVSVLGWSDHMKRGESAEALSWL